MNSRSHPSLLLDSVRWASVLALVFALLAEPAAAQEAPLSDQVEGLDTEIQQVMDDWSVPGLAVAVFTDSSVVWSRGYGERNREAGTPGTDQTLFAIGSTTKAFTLKDQSGFRVEFKMTVGTPTQMVLDQPNGTVTAERKQSQRPLSSSKLTTSARISLTLIQK